MCQRRGIAENKTSYSIPLSMRQISEQCPRFVTQTYNLECYHADTFVKPNTRTVDIIVLSVTVAMQQMSHCYIQ